MGNKSITIPSFTIPDDNKNYCWERVKLNVDGENIPVRFFDEIVRANCPYLKVVQDSYFVRRVKDDFGDQVYLYYATERSEIEKKIQKLSKKRVRKI